MFKRSQAKPLLYNPDISVSDELLNNELALLRLNRLVVAFHVMVIILGHKAAHHSSISMFVKMDHGHLIGSFFTLSLSNGSLLSFVAVSCSEYRQQLMLIC